MKRLLAGLLALTALVALVAVGCSSGAPKVAAPEVKFDYGDVPTTEADPRNHEFVIKNEGTGDLKLSDVQVKLLQGCWPPKITVGATVIKPGKQTSFVFPYHMGPGMGGPHHFQVLVKTNDPSKPTLTFDVYANSVDKK